MGTHCKFFNGRILIDEKFSINENMKKVIDRKIFVIDENL